MLFATSGDILNMSLAIGVIILVIFLSLFLFYAVLVLRDISKVVGDVEEIVSKVKGTIVEPLRAVDFLVEKVRPYVEMILDKKAKGKKGKS